MVFYHGCLGCHTTDYTYPSPTNGILYTEPFVFEDEELMSILAISNDDKNKKRVLDTVNVWEKERKLKYIQSLILHKIKTYF